MEHFINEERFSLEMKNIHELRIMGKRVGVKAATTLNKKQLIDQILEIRFGEPKKISFETRGRPSKQVLNEVFYGKYPTFEYTKSLAASFKNKYIVDDKESVSGVLELHPDGFGMLHVDGLFVSKDDVHLPLSIINNYELREGDLIAVRTKKIGSSAIDTAYDVLSINGKSPNEIKARPKFFDLIPIYPKQRFKLEGDSGIALIDLIAPIGKGQRALIEGGRSTGKSDLLLDLAISIKNKNANAFVIPVLLSKSIDEVLETGKKFDDYFSYTTFDKDCTYTIRVLSLSIARAVRMAELGRDAVVLIDDLNSVFKSYKECLNKSNNIDNKNALHHIKTMLGMGASTQNAGSLTIIAAVDDTLGEGKLLVEELYQISNMEIVLDTDLSNWQIIPPIDIILSKTKKITDLLSEKEAETCIKIRNIILKETSREKQIKILSKLVNCKSKTELLNFIE